MPPYEFDAPRKQALKSFALRLSHIGLLAFVVGLTRAYFAVIVGAAEGFHGQVMIMLFAGAVSMLAGSLLWRPADNFRRISASQGQDIPELLAGLNRISVKFGMIQWLVLAFIVLNAANLVRQMLAR